MEAKKENINLWDKFSTIDAAAAAIQDYLKYESVEEDPLVSIKEGLGKLVDGLEITFDTQTGDEVRILYKNGEYVVIHLD